MGTRWVDSMETSWVCCSKTDISHIKPIWINHINPIWAGYDFAIGEGHRILSGGPREAGLNWCGPTVADLHQSVSVSYPFRRWSAFDLMSILAVVIILYL